ncbi:MAG: hypothetical protein R3B90_01485 [Planctomycetaceae bacterium]
MRLTTCLAILLATSAMNSTRAGGILKTSGLTPIPMGSAEVYPAEDCPAEQLWQPPHLRDTPVGLYPRDGQPCSPTEGHPHYDAHSRHYGLWYRPAAFAEATGDHCGSRPWAPRGKGWANRQTGFQMDYHPFVVTQLPSQHGPSYYHRPERQPCCKKPCLFGKCGGQ